VVYGHPDAVWCLDEQSWIDLRWYASSIFAFPATDGESRLAIHMAFDCMAIAVGLIASVMATWPANERFTYGYGRIETLSGFANGIFLILISIFIMFEAIQRLLVVLSPSFDFPRC
jgi:hypothetical protein